jgi:hypothetical protein
MGNDKPNVTIDVGGEITKGHLAGNGTLEIGVSDATKASFHVDYTDEDRVVVTLASEAGFKVRSQGITLGGSASYTALERDWSGKGSIQLDVNKAVALSLEQKFGGGGNATSFGISVKF